MLYLIGLGLGFKDLSVRALEVLKGCSEVYLESYTSASNYSVAKLSKLVGAKVKVLDRKQVESEKPFLKNAKNKEVALLVYGDPISATTHSEILLVAKQKRIKTKVLHSSSVLTAVGETGLSLYRFGKTASIPFQKKNFKPESFFDVLEQNWKIGAHTLFLLDLEPKKNKFMGVSQGMNILFNIAKKRKSKLFNKKTFCMACSGLGTPKQVIKKGPAGKLKRKKFGKPACLIVPAKLTDYEKEAVNG